MTTTPPNSHLANSALKETPLKINRTHDVDYRFGGLRKARVAVLEELGSVPIVDLGWFMLNMLPTGFTTSKMKNDWELNDVLGQLTSSGAWEEGRWKAFPTNPGDSHLGEDRVFQGFHTIVVQITDVLGHPKTISPSSLPNKEPSPKISHYLTQPNAAPVSLRDNKSRPDGYFMLVDANAKESDWWSIICPAEFKRSVGDAAIKDDVEKIIWSLHHIMREDARRRFTFGITIEDTQTRFWFASRSIILVTESFNFMTEPQPLIQMVNFLTYASEEQLGYDTMMHRIPGSAGKLIIEINHERFETEKLLADYSADSLLGRGTRVWSGCFQNAPGVSAVLKDCWAEHDRKLEGDVLRTLRGKYAKLDLGPAKHNFDDYFLTLIEDGVAKLSTGAVDHTQAMMNNQKPPEDNQRLVLTNHISEADRQQQSRLLSHPVSTGLGPSPQEVMRVKHHDIKWRCHYRISFHEVATPLYDVVELKGHLKALRDAMIGIEILHTLGYVHRDISSGNVLFYQDRGILSDLEYCRPFSEAGGHDIRTGTRYFMSVEVAAGLQLFKTRKFSNTASVSSDDDDDRSVSSNDDDDSDRLSGAARTVPPFQFFILHDIESVWWLLAFALFANGVRDEHPNLTREDLQVQNAHELFPMSLSSTARQNAFTFDSVFLGMKDSLPSILHSLFNITEALRNRLVEEYCRAELTEKLDQSAVPRALSYFQRKLNKAIELAGKIILVPGLKFDRKRPAEEAGQDGREGARKIPKNT